MERCAICGEGIRDDDYWTVLDVATSLGELPAPAHVACTQQGVERWCREGRPHASPLEADRREGWAWTASPQTGERPGWPAALVTPRPPHEGLK